MFDRLRREAQQFINRAAAATARPGLLVAGDGDDRWAAGTDKVMYEVIVHMPLRPDSRDQLDRTGGGVCSYEPPDVFRLSLTPERLVAVKALSFVADVHTGTKPSALEAALAFLQPEDQFMV